MRQKFFSPKGIIKFLPILACLLITGLISCNDKSEETTTTSDTTLQGDPNNVTTTSTAAAAPNSFYTLKLDSAVLVGLLAPNGTTKLIVQVIDSSTNNPISLVAYGLRTNNVTLSGPKPFTALSNPATTFNGITILGDNELSVKDIRSVLNLTGGGPIPPADIKALQFVPQRDNNNHLYYTVTVFGVQGTAGSANTNPSPPAPPCNPCD